jgi:signal peptidase I
MTTLRRDTPAFLEITKRLLTAGYRVRFRAHGRSMRPAIGDGEMVTVEVVEPASVKRGDILLYRHRQRPVAHRVVHVQQDGGVVVGFVLRGDAKAACDAPVKPEQILGRVLLPERDIVRWLLCFFWSCSRSA